MTTAIWIASAGYVDEAGRSARSFKKWNPDCQAVLVSEWLESDAFDQTIQAPRRIDTLWSLCSTRWLLYTLGQITDSHVLIFDTDVYFLGPITELIDLIGRFDFIGAHAPARETAPTVGRVPDAFPEFNIGVIGIHNNALMRGTLLNWLNLYEEHLDVYGDNDQAPLRETLWRSALSVYAFPPEYNCRFGFGGFAGSAVKVLHGRGCDYEKAARIVNAGRNMRVWHGGDFG